MLAWLRSLVHRNNRIDLDDLSDKLERLAGFVDAHKKSEGGNPGFWLWNRLMLDVAAAYEEATGKEATVTENEHRAGGEKDIQGHSSA